MAQMTQAAAQQWPGSPCAGSENVVIVEKTLRDAAATAWYDRCYVEITRAALDDPASGCTILAHEFGHLARFTDPLNVADPAHSHDENDLMFWQAPDWITRPCFETFGRRSSMKRAIEFAAWITVEDGWRCSTTHYSEKLTRYYCRSGRYSARVRVRWNGTTRMYSDVAGTSPQDARV